MESSVAIKIKTLIEENNLSVLGLEKKAGLKINAIRSILTGHSKKPSAQTLLAISQGTWMHHWGVAGRGYITETF